MTNLIAAVYAFVGNFKVCKHIIWKISRGKYLSRYDIEQMKQIFIFSRKNIGVYKDSFFTTENN